MWYKHMVLDVSPQEKITWYDVWGSGWPFLKRQVNVWDRTSNPVLWQMFTEDSPDSMVEVRWSSILLQNEAVSLLVAEG
jgi:peptidoglycan hydrolase-like amidase